MALQYTGTSSFSVDGVAPTITVSAIGGANDQKTVSATDNDSNTTAWKYEVIAGTCGGNHQFVNSNAYTEGETTYTTGQSNAIKKVCFRSTDAAGNHGYQASAELTGLTDGIVISITNPSVAKTKTKSVSATTTQSATLKYAVIDSATSCGASVLANTSITSGTDIVVSTEGKKVCFKGGSFWIHNCL